MESKLNIMNKYVNILIIIFFITSWKYKTNNKTNFTTFKFIDTLYNLGKCIEGDTLNFYVLYKNTGKYPLKIDFTQGSCNCSQPILNPNPLNPGEIDSTHVYFYSNGKSGKYRETILFGANTKPNLNQIFFNVEVQKK